MTATKPGAWKQKLSLQHLPAFQAVSENTYWSTSGWEMHLTCETSPSNLKHS